VLAAALMAVVLLKEWQGGTLTRRGGETGAAATAPKTGSTRAVRPASPELALISGASVRSDKSALVFQWEPAASAQQYRLSILTAKLAGLHTLDQLTDCSVRLSVRDVPGLTSGESCLFRIDGLRNGAVVASSGYQPFAVP
jgi:hypothetical protein